MDIVTLIVAIVSALAALIGAGATLYIARLTVQTIQAYKAQIDIGQDQVKTTQEQTFNQMRPVLVPPEDVSGLVKTDQGIPSIQWGQGHLEVNGLQNIGVGPAFNIYGIFFPPPFQKHPPHTQRYALWNYGVLPAGSPGKKVTLSQGTSLSSETTIKGHVLYVPDDAEHIGRIVRFTLTYHDIFGRKFASIYDYQTVLGWICVGHFEDIEYGLDELDQKEPMTLMSNQMAYQMGKTHF